MNKRIIKKTPHPTAINKASKKMCKHKINNKEEEHCLVIWNCRVRVIDHLKGKVKEKRQKERNNIVISIIVEDEDDDDTNRDKTDNNFFLF